VQLRGKLFDTLNHTNFSVIGTTFGSTIYGRATFTWSQGRFMGELVEAWAKVIVAVLIVCAGGMVFSVVMLVLDTIAGWVWRHLKRSSS
jgi:hypothetical protein